MRVLRCRPRTLVVVVALGALVAVLRERAFTRSEAEFARIYGS